MTVKDIQRTLLGRAQTAEGAAEDWRENGNLPMHAECRGRAAAFREAARMLADAEPGERGDS